MRNNKGVSIISLIVTIIIIIIIAAISTPMLSSVIDDSLEQDAKVELKNVENVVANARAQILVDSFSPNQAYIITDQELISKYSGVLTDDEISHIRAINNDDSIRPAEKYYLMNQRRFDSEFGNDFNISNIRGDREYIVNYYNGLVLANYNGAKITNGNQIDISDPIDIDRGEIKAVIYPNGNSNWMKIQNSLVTFKWDPAVNSVNDIKYTWSQSVSQPADAEFTKSFAASVGIDTPYSVVLNSETGNGWYIWVKIDYKELQTGINRTSYIRSDAFFIDNEAPSFELDVNEIK